jgi:peptidoglycan L-alanyl-D-glutamate endopeptidase CwlK
MASRSLMDLSAEMYPLAERFMTILDKQGISHLVICTLRSLDEQAALYSQGRQPIEQINALRAVAGMMPIGPKEALRKVTRAIPGKSKHNPGPDGKARALDVVPLEGGKIIWQTEHPLYQAMGEIGEAAGLTWGGRWRMRDLPHYEI